MTFTEIFEAMSNRQAIIVALVMVFDICIALFIGFRMGRRAYLRTTIWNAEFGEQVTSTLPKCPMCDRRVTEEASGWPGCASCPVWLWCRQCASWWKKTEGTCHCGPPIHNPNRN